MGKIKPFESIQTIDELILFLRDRATSKKIVYQYTNVTALEGILKNKYLLLGNVMNLNDMYEYKISKQTLKNSTYLSCFSRDSSENIAMWAMYGNPWDKAVRIGFKSSLLLKLTKSDVKVYRVDESFKLDESSPVEIESISFYCVAYYDQALNRLDWSTERLYLNSLEEFKDITKNTRLHGFVKHKAWSYENEVRIIVKLKDDVQFERIGIKLPDEVLNSIEVMTGPNCNYYYRKKVEGLFQGEPSRSEFSGLIKLKEIFASEDKVKLVEERKI